MTPKKLRLIGVLLLSLAVLSLAISAVVLYGRTRAVDNVFDEICEEIECARRGEDSVLVREGETEVNTILALTHREFDFIRVEKLNITIGGDRDKLQFFFHPQDICYEYDRATKTLTVSRWGECDASRSILREWFLPLYFQWCSEGEGSAFSLDDLGIFEVEYHR